MMTQTGQIRPFPFASPRSGNLRTVLLFSIVVVLALLFVGGKVQIMRLGYEIDELEKQKRDLERMNRSLQIEASSLSAPGRIEEIAMKRFGMVRPAKENIVVVKRRAMDAPGADKRAAK